MCRIKTYLEPLAIAANVTQASHTRLDHVLLTLGNLYRIFNETLQGTPGSEVCAKVLGSLEIRWKKADQELYILAVFFNPYIRASCFRRHSLPLMSIVAMAQRAFKRFFGVDPDESFRRGLLDYARKAGEFSDEEMTLQSVKDEADSTGAVCKCPTFVITITH